MRGCGHLGEGVRMLWLLSKDISVGDVRVDDIPVMGMWYSVFRFDQSRISSLQGHILSSGVFRFGIWCSLIG